MLCHFCGIDKERTVKVYVEDNEIPERWCLECLRNDQYGAEEHNDQEEEGYGF